MNNNAIQTESLGGREDRQKADPKSINKFVSSASAAEIKIKISIKTAIIIAAIIIAAALAYAYKGLFIAATVDGRPISRLAVIQGLEKASGKNLLDSLVVEKLIRNEANAKKIVVSDDEVNGEIKKIEDRIAAQGSTLETALSAQGMTVENLKKQIFFQKEIEKLLADKINVTDEEVAQYIKNNAIAIPKEQEATIAAQIKDDLRNKKFGTESGLLISALKAQAKIRYFVNY